MKSLVGFIVEALSNVSVKELFNQIDKELKDHNWSKIAPIIESIFKNKWGKTINLDSNFRNKIGTGAQNLLLGYNIKTKAWIICYYNSRYNNVYGCLYSGSYMREIGKGPEYWGDVVRLLEDKNMKLRYADAYADECSKIITGFSNKEYNYVY